MFFCSISKFLIVKKSNIWIGQVVLNVVRLATKSPSTIYTMGPSFLLDFRGDPLSRQMGVDNGRVTA